MTNPLFYLFQKTWQYSAGNRKYVGLYTVMFIIAESVDTLMTPLVWAQMIKIVTTEGVNDGNIKKLFLYLSLVMLRVVLSWSFHGPARCIERNNAFRVRNNYSKHLVGGVISLPLEWHVNHHTGETIDKVAKGKNALYDFAEDSFIPIRAIIQFVGCYAVLSYFSHVAGAIVLGLVFVSAWITMRFDRVLIKQYKLLNTAENQVSKSIVDTIQNISTIIILRVEKLVLKAIVHKMEDPYELFKSNQRLNEFKWFLTSVCCNLMTVIVVAVYFFQHIGAPAGVLVANFYILTSYLDRISEIFFRFTGEYSQIVRRMSRVLNSEELSLGFKTESQTNHLLPKSWHELQVSNLSFSYQTEDDTVLHLDDVSFSVRRGERVAFVGLSGGGKSTFLRIMRDVYHPKEINLLVDGQEISGGFESINRAITLVQQDPEILDNTVLENITMGAEYEMSLVRYFTDMACFSEVVDALPKGFNSLINEKGVDLSGGQKQRLALSRGLLACHEKDIVLLDEPTSSLDAMTEAKVYGNILKSFADKTIISTVHGLHLLPLFDRICVFDKGRIVASGTLPELLSSSPVFFSLWESMQNMKDKTVDGR